MAKTKRRDGPQSKTKKPPSKVRQFRRSLKPDISFRQFMSQPVWPDE